MNTSTSRASMRVLGAFAFLAAIIASMPAYAQSVTCGNAGNRGAKIQGQQVYDNVPDYVESPPGTFVRNAMDFSANPSSRPTLGTGVTYTWSQGAGTAGVIAPTSGMSTHFTLPNVVKPVGAPPTWTGEVVTVVLTITSTVPACPGTWSTAVTLNVLDILVPAANLPPTAVAAASPPIADENVQVLLSGLGSSDPENHALTYSWQQLSGTPVTLATPNAQVASFIAPNTAYPSGDTLVFRLTVSDGVYVDNEDVTVNVSWINDPPVARIQCPLAVDEREQFSLLGNGSTDSDDGIAHYDWTGGWPALDLSGFSGATLALTAPTLGYQQPGNFTFRLTTRDFTGAFTFDECEVLVRDITAPVLTLPGDITEEAQGPSGNVIAYAASAFDAVDGSLVDAANFSCAPASGSTFALGVAPAKAATTAVECTAKDSAGNTSSDSFDVTVTDTTAPAFEVPADFTVEATAGDGASVSFAVPTQDAVDGAGEAACIPASGSTLAIGTHVVSCSATDQRQNTSASQSFSVTVDDTVAPEVQVPDSFTLEATGADGATATFSATWTDAVDGSGDASCVPASGSMFPIAATQVTCTKTDANGNTGSANFTVTVEDTTAPTLEAPGPFSVEATGPSGALVTFTALKHDIVDGTADASCAPASGTVFPLDATTVVCNAIDAHGNAAEPVSFVVTVVDTTPPALTVPGPLQAEATGPLGAAVPFTVSAVDLVDGSVTPTCTADSGQVFPLGTTNVSCYAIDGHGNASASQQFTVTVVDSTPPTLTVPASFTREATGPNGAHASFVATAHDLVDGDLTPVCSPASGAQFGLGGTTVTCNVADSHGNAAAAKSFTVTVVDTTRPVLSGLVDIAVNAAGNSQATVNYTMPTATDLVDADVPVQCTPPPGTFPMGTTVVQCSATDDAGNTATGSFRVTVSYAFNGFFQPVDNVAVNTVKAGSAIPVKFSLGGNQGLQIFAAGSPASGAMTCSASAPSDEVELTVTAGGSSLQYDAGADQYIYVWKTDKGWLGCRQLRVTLKDGTVRTAVFKFR
ncbi:HYR domain-containing protein [Agrilutibacter solisilvae]|uniref:HYR domain-containing protein n=1 Tax=Agrilutibacter solisilvae TaxID=2763317 RepID=A0A974XY10_9GAMM|nr:HYR domain-containing protein [Lysobacter solisilvae]QSX77819.1 HYR domain-containing protein [Lysobacter solisilvae]